MFGRVKSWVAEPEETSGGRLEGTLLDELKMMGCDFQGNLGSVGAYYGSLVKAQEQRLRQARIYTCYGSDGHNAESLKQFISEALQDVQTDQPVLLQTTAEFVAP